MTYRLTYWNKRGRGEQLRLLLNELDAPYEDVHVAGQVFLDLKQQGPSKLMFGSIPMLEDGDFRVCQGPVILRYLADKHGIGPTDPQQAAVADAIAWGAEDLRMRYFTLFGPRGEKAQREFIAGDWKSRWLFSLDGLLELNGDTGHFVGSSLTHADIAVWDAVNAVLDWVEGASLDGAPRLQRFYDGVKQRPRIAAYLASDRRAQS
jgi:glutathione S-transferase